MDLMQTSSLNYFDTKIIGLTNDYSKTEIAILQLLHLEYQESLA